MNDFTVHFLKSCGTPYRTEKSRQWSISRQPAKIAISSAVASTAILVGSIVIAMLSPIGIAHAQNDLGYALQPAAGPTFLPQNPEGPRWVFRNEADVAIVAPSFVESVIVGGISALTQSRADRSAGRRGFRSIFRNAFATEQIGQAVLDRQWNSASLGQQDAFLDALAFYLADLIIDDIPDGDFIVRTASNIGLSASGVSQTEVVTVFVGQNFSARVPWIVAEVDGQLKILDITFSGSSFLYDQKDKFDRILRFNDGSLEALIDDLGQ
jgi:ABC-type transporter MlaC component